METPQYSPVPRTQPMRRGSFNLKTERERGRGNSSKPEGRLRSTSGKKEREIKLAVLRVAGLKEKGPKYGKHEGRKRKDTESPKKGPAANVSQRGKL